MSASYGEGLALMEAEHEGHGNGHGVPTSPPRYRLSARSRVIELDGEYAGVVVTLRTNVPIGTFLGLAELSSGGDEANTMRAFNELITRLPSIIIGWNLDDEQGNPVPLTPEGIRASVPGDLLMAIIGKMSDAQTLPKA